MSDAYGTIIFTKSKDFKCDAKKMLEQLNWLRWDNFGGSWKAGAGKTFYYGERHGHDTQYPTVFPQKESWVDVYDEATDTVTRILNPHGDGVEVDWENVCESDYENITLKEMAERLAPAVKSGWFEISCTANQVLEDVYFQRLRINADGSATRIAFKSSVFENEDISEHYSCE